MKAVGYKKSLPISDPNSLEDIEIDVPKAIGLDVLVEVKAISVNPVDAKTRMRRQPENGEYAILGYDASGVVTEVGEKSTLKKGDEVYYAGSIARQGTNQQYHLVDERIAGIKPKNLSFAQAAALPLTTITAWELLFDRFQIDRKTKQAQGAILVVGGAGGVGSIMLQLLREETDMIAIATASRPETQKWCEELGAEYVIDHNKSFAEEFKRIGVKEANYIASLVGTQQHYPQLIEVLAPQGKIGVIDGPETLDVVPLKIKCASLVWEYMFARPVYDTWDIAHQGRLLNEVKDMIEAGRITTTLQDTIGSINATNLKQAHALMESGKAKGKIVLEGWN